MASEIQLLQLSPTMSVGTIVKWHVKEGDKISAGDILAEIETDKAVMEQEAFDDAVVLKLLAKEGEGIPVGDAILIVGEEGESADDVASSKPAEAAPAKPAADEAKPAAAKEESKPAAEAPAAKEPAEKAEPAAAQESTGGRVVASPLAKKMAAEHQLDLAQISGSGPNSRIIKRDIEKALSSGSAVASSGKQAAAAPALIPASTAKPQDGLYSEEVAVSGMRNAIARRLVESRQQIPSFTLTVNVNAEPLQQAINRIREIFPDEKVTMTHFIIKSMAHTLMKHDWLRTQWVGGKMYRMNTANISVAVAVEDGLLTPVIRDAHAKGVVEISKELKALAGKARDRKLSEKDLSGGTQTLSNLGMFGIDQFDAIINPPEASILAVGQVSQRAVVRNGELTIGSEFSVSISSDHRVVDGAVAASYLKDLKAALEEPLLMLV